MKNFPKVQYIKENKIEKILMGNIEEYINYLIYRLLEISLDNSSTFIKPKVIYDDPISPNYGDIRSMTCFTDRVKVVKIISTNPVREKHWSVSVGATILLDYKENYPLAFFDATAMSSIRTAAIAVISSLFTENKLNDVLLIGYGRVGKSIEKIIKKLNGNLRIVDPILKTNSKKGYFNSLDKYSAKTIITATTSRKAFLTIDNVDADFIVSVGADTAFNFELDRKLLIERGYLYTDCPDAAHVGDVSLIENSHRFIKGDILDLIKNKNAKTLVSVGSPLMDALTIEFLSFKLRIGNV